MNNILKKEKQNRSTEWYLLSMVLIKLVKLERKSDLRYLLHSLVQVAFTFISIFPKTKSRFKECHQWACLYIFDRDTLFQTSILTSNIYLQKPLVFLGNICLFT